jgi:hypothetical protein
VSQVNRATSETLRQQATQEGLVPLKGWVKNALDHVIQVCMSEPALEFVWVGDDAVDPLEQAQTLNILVAAGIKTREEARADLGLGAVGGAQGKGPPSTAKRLEKYNPHHDERGLFSTADDAVATVGSPARKSHRTGVQVASLDNNISTDATVDAGTADQGTVAQMNPTQARTMGRPRPATENTGPEDGTSQSPDQQAPTLGTPIIHDVPDDAVSLTAGDGTRFYAPPYARPQSVYADGQAHWQDPVAALLAVGHYGTHDYQKDKGVFYSAYTDASNYAVGVYMAGAGYSYDATIAIAGFFANLHSSNAGSERQSTWWTRGWNDATNSAGPLSRAQKN